MEPARLLCPLDSPGKNTQVGSHSLLQGIFPTQGLNTGLWLCRQILYHLSHQESLIKNIDSYRGLREKSSLIKEWLAGSVRCPWWLSW